MLEQELASIIAFLLNALGEIYPYYHEMPQSFKVPAIYFPSPEVNTGADTLESYTVEYAWYIKIFCNETQDAYALAMKALLALRNCRNLISLIDEDGKETGETFRLRDPSMRVIDTGTVQLQINFVSRRKYAADESELMRLLKLNIYPKS